MKPTLYFEEQVINTGLFKLETSIGQCECKVAIGVESALNII